MRLTLDIEQDADGCWVAEVTELPGVVVYGESQEKAVQHARALAFRVIADRLESGELNGASIESVSFAMLNQPQAIGAVPTTT